MQSLSAIAKELTEAHFGGARARRHTDEHAD
jgi:hypothetical protein